MYFINPIPYRDYKICGYRTYNSVMDDYMGIYIISPTGNCHYIPQISNSSHLIGIQEMSHELMESLLYNL